MQHLEASAMERLANGLASPEERALAQDHLARCPECSRRLEDLQAKTEVRAPPPELLARQDSARRRAILPRGHSVGRYLILAPVGSGGMGVVYAAYDPELNRKVALKLLHADLKNDVSHDEAQARLLREAQAMARVSHPNVTAIHDVGTYGSQVFLALDLIDGTDLRAWLFASPRPWRQVLDVLVAAGQGLAAAHKAGLVHRDFKPENVLVGHDGRVQVTDFGLARLADFPEALVDELGTFSSFVEDKPRPLSDNLTEEGYVVGTPSYMSPEQHLGLPADPRSDQYGFCATLYYALFRQRPVDPRALREALERASSSRRRENVASFPSTEQGFSNLIQTPPRDVHVPSPVRRALLKGLSIRPEDRFSSMDELLAQLIRKPSTTRSLQFAGIALVMFATLAFAVRTYQERKAALCSGAESRLTGVWDSEVARRVESAFFATGAPYAAHTYTGVKAALDRYARQWTTMHKQACEATRMRGEQTELVLSLRMACLDRRLKELDSMASILSKADVKSVNRAVDAVQALPAVDACGDVESLLTATPLPPGSEALAQSQQITALLARTRAQHAAARFGDAKESALEAVQAARRLGHLPLLGESLVELGLAQYRLGDWKASEQALSEAWTAGQGGRDDAVCLRAAGGLINSLGEMQGRYDEARVWALIGEGTLGRMGRRPALELELRNHLATLLFHDQKFAEARAQYQAALAVVDNSLGHDHPSRIQVLNGLAVIYNVEGDYAGAARWSEEALTLSEKLKGPGHPQAGLAHNTLADTYLTLGQLQKANEHAQKAVSIIETALGKDSWILPAVLTTQAEVLLELDKPEEALVAGQRALVIAQKRGTKNDNLVGPLSVVGGALLKSGRPQEAVPLLERCVQLSESIPAGMATARFALAQALMQVGSDRERARSLAVRAREGFLKQKQEARAAKVQAWLDEQPR